MAGRRYSATKDGIPTGTARRVMVEIGAPAGIDLLMYHWAITGQGTVSNATPVLLEIARATTSMTSTGTITPMPIHRSGQASFPTTATAEHQGTSTFPHSGVVQDVLYTYRIPPTTGFDMWYPESKEVPIFAGQFLWFIATAAADVNMDFIVEFEE